MKTMSVLFVLSLSASALASTQYVCGAVGVLNLPPYPQTITVRGEPADTEMEAMANAQMACFGQGLSQCQVTNCTKTEK